MEGSHSQSPRLLNRSSILCAFLLLLLAAFLDAKILFQSNVAVGIDGYYYVLQIETFLRDGKFYLPTSTPAVLLLLSRIGALIGDPVQSVKIGAILLQASLSAGIFALLVTISRNGWIALIGMLIASFSGLHLYFIGEFINNLGSMAFLVWGVFALARYRQTRTTPWLIPALLLFACALFSHRATIGIIAVIGVSVLFSLGFVRIRKICFLWIFVFLFIIAVPLALYWQPCFELPVWLSREILPYPQNPFRSFLLPETLMVIGAAIVGVFSLLRQKEQTDSTQVIAFLAVLIWSFFTTLNPFLSHQTGLQGIVGRLDTLIYIQAALAVPLSIAPLKASNLRKWLAAFPVAALLAWSFLMPEPFGFQSEYLNERAELIAYLKGNDHHLCKNPIVVAPHGRQFVITSVLGIPSQQRRSADKYYQCTFWLIQETADDTKTEFLLVEDSHLRSIIAERRGEDLSVFFAKNPHLSGD